MYLAGPAFSWAIALLDLGVFLPLTVATCVGLARGRPWAQKALYTVAGWFGLVGLAVAGDGDHNVRERRPERLGRQ